MYLCMTTSTTTTKRRWIRLTPLALATLTLLLAGCGLSSQAGLGATPQASTPATATASPTTPSAQITSGIVALRLGQSHYGTSDSILVVVANGLQSEIFAADHRSDCTVLTIELQAAAGSWQPLASCRIETVTRLVPIAAGTTLAQTLRPNATWQPGTYRIVLSFFLNDEWASQMAQIVSNTFTIG
jgi:hypothetical protein